MMKSGIPIRIIGFDICFGEAAWSREDMEFLMASQKEEVVFAVQCNRSLPNTTYKQVEGTLLICLMQWQWVYHRRSGLWPSYHK